MNIKKHTEQIKPTINNNKQQYNNKNQKQESEIQKYEPNKIYIKYMLRCM